MFDNLVIFFGLNFGNVFFYDWCNLLIIVVGGGFWYGLYVVYDVELNMLFVNFFVMFV